MVKEKQLALIPENLWKKFLTLPFEGCTILREIAFHDAFAYVPIHLLTAENLTDGGDTQDGSALSWIALKGRLHQVPWETFSARKWSRHLQYLKRIRQEAQERTERNYPKSDPPNGLAAFIKKIEAVQKLKGVEEIEREGIA